MVPYHGANTNDNMDDERTQKKKKWCNVKISAIMTWMEKMQRVVLAMSLHARSLRKKPWERNESHALAPSLDVFMANYTTQGPGHAKLHSIACKNRPSFWFHPSIIYKAGSFRKQRLRTRQLQLIQGQSLPFKWNEDLILAVRFGGMGEKGCAYIT